MMGDWISELRMIGVSLAGQMPFFAVMIVALFAWLRHWRRGTRGMNLLGMGILSELALTFVSPFLSTVINRLYFGTSPTGISADPYVFFLAQNLLFATLNAVPMGLILWGAFTIARERLDEEESGRP